MFRYYRYRDEPCIVGHNIMDRVLKLLEKSITREFYGLDINKLMKFDLTTFEELEKHITEKDNIKMSTIDDINKQKEN